jgi:hypothetical protein
MVEGYNIRQLVALSGHSRATIQRILYYWLQRPPAQHLVTTTSSYVIFDGTFLHHRFGVYVAMDGMTHQVLYGAYGINEGPRDLLKFCLELKEQGLEPKSATMDGNPHIFRAARTVWPSLVTQRCLVHIQRQGLSWCRRHTTRSDARHLRQLLLQVLTVRSQAHRRRFEHLFNLWNAHDGQRLASTTNRGPVTSDLQRARSMILKALPYMFSYLDDHNIPRSTNALEGYFARLKQHYRQHRGLSMNNRQNYFRWYFYLCPR